MYTVYLYLNINLTARVVPGFQAQDGELQAQGAGYPGALRARSRGSYRALPPAQEEVEGHLDLSAWSSFVVFICVLHFHI